MPIYGVTMKTEVLIWTDLYTCGLIISTFWPRDQATGKTKRSFSQFTRAVIKGRTGHPRGGQWLLQAGLGKPPGVCLVDLASEQEERVTPSVLASAEGSSCLPLPIPSPPLLLFEGFIYFRERYRKIMSRAGQLQRERGTLKSTLCRAQSWRWGLIP